MINRRLKPANTKINQKNLSLNGGFVAAERHNPRKDTVEASQQTICCEQFRGKASVFKKLGRAVASYCVASLIALFSTLFLTTSAQAEDDHSKVFQLNLPEQSLAQALNRLSEQTDIQVLFPYEIVKAKKANTVVGTFTLQKALDTMLQNTGLNGGLTDSGVITISQIDLNSNGKGKDDMNIKTKKSLLATLIAFFATGAVTQGVMAQDVNNDGQTAKKQNQIDEIIVTASKRESSLQDTAMTISALDGDTIDKRGLVGMGDYLSTIPGVTMQDRGASQNSIVIRGLSADPQGDDSTAGVYFGETPLTDLGNDSGLGGSGNADIKMVDIERVEVLRGPQGTLYGSGSMAGTVRIIPVAPNLEQVEGKLVARYSQTGEKGDDNNMVQAVLNAPLVEDQLAVRAVVYQFDNSGYIENVAASQPTAGNATTIAAGGVARDRDDVGADKYTGFRLATLWQPIEPLDVTLGYIYQKIQQDGQPDVDLNLAGSYQQRRFNTGSAGTSYELLDAEIDVVSLVANYDLGWGSISSSSSWLNHDSAVETDVTASYAAVYGVPDQPYYFDVNKRVHAFVEELRLTSQLDGSLQFVAGLYYEDKESETNAAATESGTTGIGPSTLVTADSEKSIKQLAVFGELTYTITEQLSATLGARHYDYEKDFVQGITIFGSPVPNRESATEEAGETYKINLTYTPNDDVLVYGQWTEGFRLGDGQPENPLCTAEGITSPSSVESDTSENYELGLKTSLADQRVTLNAAVYRVDWKGIPVNVNPAGNCFYKVNAVKAKSEGVELELRANLSESLQLNFSGSYGESKLVGDSPIGSDGQNLPGSADVNASLGLQYDFMIASHNSFARIDYSYMGEYYSTFDESLLASGGFSQVNLKTGIAFDQLTLDLFVNNVTNDDGLTWVDNLNKGVFSRANVIRPRTIGLTLGYQF